MTEAADLDETDLAILAALNENARKSYRDMAKELGIALSTVSNRVKRLEDAGVIRGSIPLIDAAKLGYDLVVAVGVRIAHGQLLDVQREIAALDEVFAVYDVTGNMDSLILARFKGRAELDAFIKGLLGVEHVESTTTHLVLNSVKDEKRVVIDAQTG